MYLTPSWKIFFYIPQICLGISVFDEAWHTRLVAHPGPQIRQHPPVVYLLFLQSCSADIEADGGGLGADADNDAEAGLAVDADSAADSDADADTPQARFPDTRPVCRLLPMSVFLTQHLLVFLPPDCT